MPRNQGADVIGTGGRIIPEYAGDRLFGPLGIRRGAQNQMEKIK